MRARARVAHHVAVRAHVHLGVEIRQQEEGAGDAHRQRRRGVEAEEPDAWSVRVTRARSVQERLWLPAGRAARAVPRSTCGTARRRSTPRPRRCRSRATPACARAGSRPDIANARTAGLPSADASPTARAAAAMDDA